MCEREGVSNSTLMLGTSLRALATVSTGQSTVDSNSGREGKNSIELHTRDGGQYRYYRYRHTILKHCVRTATRVHPVCACGVKYTMNACSSTCFPDRGVA